ncbi:phage holin family protein [Methylobacterium sp. R2-1]|uniref:phage holin family protein n=1 Tax=Methylobacterium sp. R2-1 TaxID=2587064 RepID=UPI001618F29A|nr:phage holin family protein [Methylobacterium sp. R2-1]MBB2964651.1 polyferredoxin [Methylobacterium sp. R2-1]
MSEQAVGKGRSDDDPRNTAVLILAAIREAHAHLSKLLRLARTEIRGNLHALAALVLLFGGALLLTGASLVLLLIALRDALAVLIGNDTLAALIVALPFVIAAVVLLVWAQRVWSRPSVED